MINKLAWVTAREARGTDEDEPQALEAIRRRGVEVEVVDWDDTDADWASFDRVVIRSPWDYAQRVPEFLAWVDRASAATDLVNPRKMVASNIDKRYLADLAVAGVPITPTTFAEPGVEPVFPGGAFIVKPAVGAGSRDASSYQPEQSELARAHVARLQAAGNTALIQPLIASVATEGEWALLFFGGKFSHAVNKRVTLPQASLIEEFFAPETTTAHTASPAQLELAEAAMRVVTEQFGTPTYARIDIVRGDEGEFRVLEVELIEPSFFLPYATPDATERFVDAVLD